MTAHHETEEQRAARLERAAGRLTPIREASGRVLEPGEIRVVGRHVYARCAACNRIVRVDKPLLGGLHICREGS